MSRRYDPSEPRRPDLAKPYRFRPSDDALPELMAILSLVSSGLSMITRFAIWPWFSILFATSCILGQKKLATSRLDPDNHKFSGWTCLMFGLTSWLSIYIPLLLGQVGKAGGFPIGFNKGLIPV
ncbi:uncharacterized protein JCM15063_001030 [Sporobolomyces koalae]|uniref:uncharacterized protein n=1 Tax=Sporobolomyces koalae TaxID=500713 RepID=UPI00317335EF